MYEYDLFLSYRGKSNGAEGDRLAGVLATRLRQCGFHLFFAETKLDRKSDLLNHVHSSKVLLALLVPGFFTKWCAKEVATAISCDKRVVVVTLTCFPVKVEQVLEELGTLEDIELNRRDVVLLSETLKNCPTFQFDEKTRLPNELIHTLLECAGDTGGRTPGGIWFKVPEADEHCPYVDPDERLQALHNSLHSSDRPAAARLISQTVTGTGGFGKTALVSEYARKYRNRYGLGVIWINADTEETLLQSFFLLAESLGVDIDEKKADDSEGVRQQVWSEMERRTDSMQGSWLFIFDNADSPDFLKQWLPPKQLWAKQVLEQDNIAGKACAGYVLITSRLTLNVFHECGVESAEANVVIGKLDLPASKRVLLSSAGREESNLQQADVDAIATLAGPTGVDGFPLALKQLGGMVRGDQERTFVNLKEKFLAKREGLFQEQGDPSVSVKTIFTLWQDDLDWKLDSGIREALEVMCTCFGPDEIPLALLTSSTNRQDQWEVAHELANLSLIRFESKTCSAFVHRVTRAVVRETSATSTSNRVSKGVQSCNNACSEWAWDYETNFESLESCTRTRPFLQHLRLVLPLGVEHQKEALKSANLALLFVVQGHLERRLFLSAQACKAYDKAISLLDTVTDMNDKKTLLAVAHAGQSQALKYKRNSKRQVLEKLHDALAISGTNNSFLGQLNLYAAEFYWGQLRYLEDIGEDPTEQVHLLKACVTRGISTLEKSVDVRDKKCLVRLAAKHMELLTEIAANVAGNQSTLDVVARELKMRIKMADTILATLQRKGEECAVEEYWLLEAKSGWFSDIENNDDKSLELGLRQLEIARRVFGDSHPGKVAGAHRALGVVYYNLRQLEEALEQYECALRWYETQYGKNALDLLDQVQVDIIKVHACDQKPEQAIEQAKKLHSERMKASICKFFSLTEGNLQKVISVEMVCKIATEVDDCLLDFVDRPNLLIAIVEHFYQEFLKELHAISTRGAVDQHKRWDQIYAHCVKCYT